MTNLTQRCNVETLKHVRNKSKNATIPTTIYCWVKVSSIFLFYCIVPLVFSRCFYEFDPLGDTSILCVYQNSIRGVTAKQWSNIIELNEITWLPPGRAKYYWIWRCVRIKLQQHNAFHYRTYKKEAKVCRPLTVHVKNIKKAKTA